VRTRSTRAQNSLAGTIDPSFDVEEFVNALRVGVVTYRNAVNSRIVFGVTAATEGDVRVKFQTKLARWLEITSQSKM
jgi:hypothetical protein